MVRFLKAIESGCAWFGKAAAWTVPLLVLGTCLTILMVHLRMNVLMEWSVRVPLFGDQLSLSNLNELQWHLFAIMVMLGGVYALHENSHVCVDFLACRFSARTRAIVTVLGDLLLLLPFSVIMTVYAWDYTMAAFNSGEGSSYGGLSDRWIIKAFLPLGFGLLVVFGVARVLRITTQLLTSSIQSDTPPSRTEP